MSSNLLMFWLILSECNMSQVREVIYPQQSNHSLVLLLSHCFLVCLDALDSLWSCLTQQPLGSNDHFSLLVFLIQILLPHPMFAIPVQDSSHLSNVLEMVYPYLLGGNTTNLRFSQVTWGRHHPEKGKALL